MWKIIEVVLPGLFFTTQIITADQEAIGLREADDTIRVPVQILFNIQPFYSSTFNESAFQNECTLLSCVK